MAWAQGKTLHTTRTGRANPHGKVTRKSHEVRKTKYPKRQDRPLGFDHMCHPQKLEPTPKHPGCMTRNIGFNMHAFRHMRSIQFLNGEGLARTARGILDDWLLVRYGKVPLGFAPSHVALSYCRAAADVGVELRAYREV